MVNDSMHIESIGCFYYPTTTLFLDDSQNFLGALELELADKLSMCTTKDPAQAKELIQKTDKKAKSKIFHALPEDEADSLNGRLMNVDIGGLYKLAYDSGRYAQISTLVVDHHMPDITGIQFCEALVDSDIAKIILTAEADKDLAIEALNKGAINKFLFKHSPDLYENLQNEIKKSQFIGLTH